MTLVGAFHLTGAFPVGRRVIFEEFGGPEVLHIVEAPDDTAGEGEIRLRVRAIGLNRTEITLRSGRSPRKPMLPSRIGFEAAGEIDALGGGVEGFEIGDRVALIPTYSASQYGLYADTSVAPARSLVKLAPGTRFEDGAATWVAFGTAWSGLVDAGAVQASQTVVITAASSSVGLAAIQIAKRLGAQTIAVTRNSAKYEALLNSGADAVVVTERVNLNKEIMRLTDGHGADLILDAVGGPDLPQLMKGTRDGGVLLLYGALATEPTTVSPFDIFGRNIVLRGFALPSIANDATKFRKMVDFISQGLTQGSLKPTIARTFPLSEIVNAHRYLERGEHLGKVVVTTG
jgi:NADPH:quinone reductase-like Zn-dependent oxidoreductase